MNSAVFGWESLLDTDAAVGCFLKAALFTTYDRADERLIVEHLLPVLLKLNREPEGEGAERQYFLLELDGRLKELHDRILVISSTTREEPGTGEEGESGPYGWIWRLIRHSSVGSDRSAVQHAKLWLFHWASTDEQDMEYLEIVVSSANLTRAAFKGQMQAAWRACVEVHPRRSNAQLRSWGVLPEFLRELAESADEKEPMARFIDLLARAECPENVTFVASVPGTYSPQELRRSPWGSAGLEHIAPKGRGRVRVSILCPFVGLWTEQSLSQWCSIFGGSPDCIQLVWIDKEHPWARAARWLLPDATLQALKRAGATLLQLRPLREGDASPFHEDQQPGDERWSHAKLYSLTRGRARRLLVTSANFSSAAWGREDKHGKLTIENFELGVCLNQGIWPLSSLDRFPNENAAATTQQLPPRCTPSIAWARAVWDGRKVSVSCRCEADGKLEGQIISDNKRKRITNWTIRRDRRLRSARSAWTDAGQPPFWVRLTCGQDTTSVAVFDERPSQERENTVPPEVDGDISQILRDELLFEQYGDRIAADDVEDLGTSDDIDDDSDDETKAPRGRNSDTYSVPAFVLARLHLHTVDNWAEQLKAAAGRNTNEFELRVLRRDGELLIEAFKRRAGREHKNGIGSILAAEELAIRLKHFPEV
jgi:hypothetical protein